MRFLLPWRHFRLGAGDVLGLPRSRPSSRLPRLLVHAQTRGKRTKTVLKLEDLPQGVLMPSVAKPNSKAKKSKAVDGTEDEKEDGKEEQKEDRDTAEDTAYPTVILQARRNMHRFANCVLLTRVGGFYELYFEHASDYAPLLNIKLASKKTNAGPVPMAGFPFFQLDRFLKILVHDLSRYVAIAEEFPNNAADKIKSGGLMHDRRVARIVTPGTLIDENFIDPYTNNYVLAIHTEAIKANEGESEDGIGLAWLDLSTGHFYTQPATLPALGSILSRIAPREIVLDERLADTQDGKEGSLSAVLSEERQQLVTYTSFPPRENSVADWRPVLESDISAEAASEFTPHEVSAGSLLLHYVRDRLQPQGSGQTIKLQPPIRYGRGESEAGPVMTIDKNSMRSLEIKQTLRDGMFKGSLLHAIRRTVTRSGARLLNEWLSAPSISLDIIQKRQDLVARFIQDEDLRDGITTLLKRSHDSHRLVQKFALGRGDPDDLLDLAKTITATEDIIGLLSATPNKHESENESEGGSDSACLSDIVDRIELDRPRAVAERIQESVDEEGLMHQHELEDSEADAMISLAEEVVQAEGESLKKKTKAAAARAAVTSTPRRQKLSFRDYYGEDNEAWVMKPDASGPLKKLHARLADLTRERGDLTEELRERLAAPSLVLKWTPGLGHICHVKGKDAKKKSDDSDATTASLTTLSSSRTTRSLHVPEWTALGQRLDQVRLHIRGEEQRVFASLREAVVRSLVPLRKNAAVLDELDIATSFARLALEQNLNRPRLNRGTATAIVGGRHPTVEGGLAEQGRSFTRNDLFLGAAAAETLETPETPSTANDAERPNAGRIWLVTGPNMAGKSTFLRQNALITILAQVGCYVPADYAELGLVDALFSRVGSADNLFRDQSTFMVEMLETAHILKEATPRSFVIMDEIGRGTTPEDGTAVGYAALHHLVHVNRCRALFATHFHGVAELAAADGLTGANADGKYPIELYCTDVEEDGRGGFVYVHRLRRGINRQSHALKVARLAGLPEPAIQVAQQVLAKSLL
ncbi:dna mismatch repair protein [Ophiostoma piceae UAMH 11346]|uniref:Dna mismatch repair protein n=1 Tax=Ophiostoma piceae (strain UAMH 11346) TaxID=1262450 RepID=S3BYN2_OPHP1|nr:dna mismatch repair protein [Ophiostoma piceae UAMH 11346]